MHISLTPELENLVKEKLNSGLYNNSSEVIRDALRQMNRYDEFFYGLKKEHLINLLEEGEKSGKSDLSVFDIIRQEKEIITIATDQGFLFQTHQTVFYAALEKESIGIDFIQAKSDQIIDVSLHFFHITDQELDLQYFDIEWLETGVVVGLINRPLDRGIEKGLN